MKRVTTSDGLQLAVYPGGTTASDPTLVPAPAAERADAGRPVILFVHGYPDNASLWDAVIGRLDPDFRCVSMDVRGAGRSEQPANRAGYGIDQLQRDIGAVLDAISPDAPVHLVAHDWGSIQAWQAATEPALQQRIASLTSLSGPCLDHAARWLAGGLADRHRRAAALRQLAHSYYIAMFQVPVLPELLWRSGLLDRLVGKPGGRYRRAMRDRINGLELYRANFRGDKRSRTSAAEALSATAGTVETGARRAGMPVQVVAPAGDPYVTPALQLQAPVPFAEQLYARPVAGDHWLPLSAPALVASLVAEFVTAVGSTGSAHHDLPPTLVRARRRVSRSGDFAGELALITGAGSGMGRELARLLARQGADLVLADIDPGAAEATADAARLLGAEVSVHQLDVADLAQWQALTEVLLRDRGTPTMLVNNAGIGMAGPFLDTSARDWDRILDVNLRSVIHGSRLFGAAMVDAAIPGRIVNLASAAAFTPSRTYPAYATTKAAVLMLSECLAAELASVGISVTAVCPGIIDTPLAATTRHVGLDPSPARAKQQRAVASYRRRNYTPERAARRIASAARNRSPICYITAEAYGGVALDRYLPAAQRRLARLDLTEL